MIGLRKAYRLFVVVVAMCVSIATTANERVCTIDTVSHTATSTATPEQPTIDRYEALSLLAPRTITNSGSVQTVVARTLRTLRTSRLVERFSTEASAVRTIDSTVANRYGLYNHKILFVSRARHYYLYRLERLRI